MEDDGLDGDDDDDDDDDKRRSRIDVGRRLESRK